jgi:hypothetical protein
MLKINEQVLRIKSIMGLNEHAMNSPIYDMGDDSVDYSYSDIEYGVDGKHTGHITLYMDKEDRSNTQRFALFFENDMIPNKVTELEPHLRDLFGRELIGFVDTFGKIIEDIYNKMKQYGNSSTEETRYEK